MNKCRLYIYIYIYIVRQHGDFKKERKTQGEKESRSKVRNKTYKILYGLLKGCKFCSGIPSDQFKERSSISYTAQFPHAQKEE